MNHYANYVFSAFAIVLALGAGNLCWYWYQYRRQLQQLKQQKKIP